jgi:hypothetical protein
MTAITIGFSIPVAAHSSHCHDKQVTANKHNNLSLFSIVAAVAGQLLQGLSPTPFSLLVQ